MALTREYGKSTRLFWERWDVAPDSYVLQQEMLQIKIAFTSSLSDNWVDDYFTKVKDTEGLEYLKLNNLFFILEVYVSEGVGPIGELKEMFKIVFNFQLEIAGETARVLNIDLSTKKFNWFLPVGAGIGGVGAVVIYLKRRK